MRSVNYTTPAAGACVLACLLTGCLAPPRHHAWEASPSDAAALRDAAGWIQLATDNYARVPDSRRAEAVGLLQDRASLKSDLPTLSRFAPDLLARDPQALQAYLVRGASFTRPPVYTVVRFDEAAGSLLIEQFSYNGETALPIQWTAQPNALVVVVPRAPDHVYVRAVLEGDGIFRGRNPAGVDTR